MGGVVAVRVANTPWQGELGGGRLDMGDLQYWSMLTPFGWLWLDHYYENYGQEEWAINKCIEWFEYDGRRQNIDVDLEQWARVFQRALNDSNYLYSFPARAHTRKRWRTSDALCRWRRATRALVVTPSATSRRAP